jgi:predicted DCC family thiol-disulfide oxidoreductase YuxK
MRLLAGNNLDEQRKARPFGAGGNGASDSDPDRSSVAPNGTIFFDASCGMCSAGVRRFERIVTKHGFVFEPLQSPGVAEMLGLEPGQIPDDMKLRTPNGTIVGGADAFVYISRHIWWAWPFFLASKLPGSMWVMRKVYARIARNRHRISAACRIG